MKTTALLIISILAVLLSACSNNSSFQSQVKADVNEIKQQIKATHPAFLKPEDNQEFIAWWHNGDKLVEEKLPLVKTQHDATALLNYYILGYKEPHMSARRYTKCKLCLRIPLTRVFLVNFTDTESDLSYAKWSGFFVDLVEDEFIVGHTSQNWPIDLPPAGAKLQSCDQQKAHHIYHQKILPYIDQRAQIDTSSATALFTFSFPHLYPILAQQHFSNCQFQLIDGSLKNYALTWQGAEGLKQTKDDWQNLGKKLNQGKKPQLGIENKSDLTWVSVPSFTLSSKKVAHYNTVLKQVQQLTDDDTLVVDLRGNQGGSLYYMAQLIQSIYPSITSLRYTGTAEPIAHVKASKQLIEFYQHHLNLFEQAEQNTIPPKKQFELDTISRLSRLLKNHKNAKQALVLTKQQQSELFSYIYQENTRQQDFAGKVILLTAQDCFSACLTFVDLLRTKDQVVHVGKTTNADTKYLTNIHLSTSKGKKFRLPVMHFPNRVRADNQPIYPQHQYPGYIWDTAKVAQWILSNQSIFSNHSNPL
ncbi:S41 family peptidase [Catenovulum agarivorans]|uniref:S41 family peptidase n=1 Tax=Catenovulum agarivorans TaxID=1172192 RepID=UPI0002F9FAC3|nr:S41 family peptidase [Catenovulum agarivorans]